MNYESILKRANDLYRDSKGDLSNHMHVEIRSDQAKSILQALVEAINAQELLSRPSNVFGDRESVSIFSRQ